ncbi:MAG: deoxyribodipyrimidine photo-lyase [Eubacteriaceae bacterium]|nr:deoxyribodipyrimidine photo-lyase [Eubacteriaceae bacterium]
MENRMRMLNALQYEKGRNVVYWMSRDQRIEDNWALLYAQKNALEDQSSLSVVFCLVTDYPEAAKSHFDFMMTGLFKLIKKLEAYHIPLHILRGKPDEVLPAYLILSGSSRLVSDFSPLHVNQEWKESVTSKIHVPHSEVDTRNIVPCFKVSSKKEYGAYTLRPKINRLMGEFLTDIPSITQHPIPFEANYDFDTFLNNHQVFPDSFSVCSSSGEDQAKCCFNGFVENTLERYASRNDPNADAVSHLSKYLHFGQISSQRIAYEISKNRIPDHGFLEELIVRRELGDNFCFYEKNYDNALCFPDWAKLTLNDHRNDFRDYLYDIEAFEAGKTHEPLWNAAQNQMTSTGYMHGYMRMYWAKKILEWSPDPETAMAIAIYLNNKYQLDGRDPNGYAGIAWSIGGVHDRAWVPRNVFGKIRYMNYNGCKRKFDVDKYIKAYI